MGKAELMAALAVALGVLAVQVVDASFVRLPRF